MRSHVESCFESRPVSPVHLCEAPCSVESPLRLSYSSGMTGRIGAKGQVVIPKALRDRAHLQPGDEIDFELREEEIVLIARRSPARLDAPRNGAGHRALG
jgi:AbrB family looped-hinge helix DNA binding protein